MAGVIVEIKFYGWLREAAGVASIEMELSRDVSTALREVIRSIKDKNIASVENAALSILINGVRASEYIAGNRSLESHDTIALIPVVGGG